MTGLNTEINQIGDICPQCNKQKLVYVGEGFPYTDEYLWCSENYEKEIGCNSTFSIKYKQIWTEDVNGIACDMHDVLEKEFKERGMKLTNEKSDEIYEKLQNILEEFSTGDYKHHH